MPKPAQARIAAPAPRAPQLRALAAKGNGMSAVEQRQALATMIPLLLDRIATLEARLTRAGL